MNMKGMSDRPSKMLLIEDDPEYAYMMQQMLAITPGAPPTLECADSLSTGLERLARGDIDVVLLDLSLPDSWGLETFDRVHACAPQAPIIILSGLDDQALAVEMVRKGAQDYLVKGQLDGNLMVRAMRYAIERKRAEEEIRHRNEELMALNALSTTISQSPNLDHILHAAVDKVLEVMSIDAGWIQLLDENTGLLSLAANRGFSQKMLQETKTVKLGESMTGRVAQLGEPIVVNKVSDDSHLSMESGSQENLHAFAGVPIKSKDNVLGVLGIFSRSPRELSVQETQLLIAIGHQVGVAIENARLAQEASEIEILQELNRLRSELIANVSHELRTPLGLIKVFCTTLLREDVGFDREMQQRFLRNIDDETDKLERIVDNLLDLSRMESGRLRLDKRPIDVGQLAQKVMDTMKMDIQPTQHRFVHDFPTIPLMAIIDPKRIEQVLRNLMSNAIKYSPGGGTITIGGRGDKRQLLVWVRDQGIGIHPQDLERVFDRFYRVENETTQRVRGAGLGLSVCQGILEAHGERIWVESTPGTGSTFYFTLKRMKPAPEPVDALAQRGSESVPCHQAVGRVDRGDGM